MGGKDVATGWQRGKKINSMILHCNTCGICDNEQHSIFTKLLYYLLVKVNDASFHFVSPSYMIGKHTSYEAVIWNHLLLFKLHH